MRKLTKTTVLILSVVLLFSNIAFATPTIIADIGQTIDLAARGSDPKKPEVKKEVVEKTTTKTARTEIPRVVQNSRNKEVNKFLEELYELRKKGVSKSLARSKVLPHRASVTVVERIKYSTGETTSNYKELFSSYVVHLTGKSNNMKTTTSNWRTKDFTWTVDNLDTGKKVHSFVTKGNRAAIVFSAPGTYFVRANETLIRDVYEQSKANVILSIASYKNIQNYTATGPKKHVRTEEKSGLTTKWEIVVSTDDVGKQITFPPPGIDPPLDGDDDGPINKIDVKTTYELVE